MWTHLRHARKLHKYTENKVINKQIDKILIANRGEIACRIIRSAQRLGIRCVAVYSDADYNSDHSQIADESYCIGASPSDQSYLVKQKLIDVAVRSNAKAIHPGYGFLSENVEFAQMCANNDITFIGPPVSAIRDMGIKSTSKAIMIAASVPVVPGYHGHEQNDEYLLDEANKIGFPVMIKAVRGGGGKGMRIATDCKQFKTQLESARTEAMKSFGDDVMLIEKFVFNPRHVEVQIFGDHYNNYVYLFERDCSVQRRHQKIIEESPAPNINQEIREQLGTSAVTAAAAVNYVGAGTVEFIFDPKDSKFYFMEMNTRLQVEHPVTEMVTGVDLVEWQIKVASGQELPLKQSELKLNGHSFEARIYAEDPDNNFMPCAGPLLHIKTPTPDSSVRVETGVRTGDEVSVHYDPMIAKLVVWSSDRQNALLKLRQCLSQYNIAGVQTNIDFLMRLCNHQQFKMGNVYTNFIEDHNQQLFASKQVSDNILCVASVAVILNEKLHEQNRYRNECDPHSPFSACDSKRLYGLPSHRYIHLVSNNQNTHRIKVNFEPSQYYSFEIDNKTYDNVTGKYNAEQNTLTVEMCGIRNKYGCFIDANNIYIFTDSETYLFELETPDYLAEQILESESTAQSVTAPMPGIIEKILVTSGQRVEKGDNLLVMIAMKMEYVIKANCDSVIDEILYKPGDNVPKGALLVTFQK